MKRNAFLIVLCTMSLLTAGAQGTPGKTKMSSWLQSQYRQHQEVVKKNGGQLRVKGRPVRNYILTLVQSSDEAQALRQKGGVVWQDFADGICAAFLPMDSLGVLDRSASILRMEANEPSKLQNDTSAIIIGVDKAWNFEQTLNDQTPALKPSMPQAFTGKGVIAGVIDTGFDFTHLAFRNDDGTSRIKWFWDPLVPNANNDLVGMMYTSPELVLAARHSSAADFEDHGTHVMGSMAGRGLNGRYIGMAPEADIMGAYIPLEGMPKDFLGNFGDYIKRHIGIDLLIDDAILQAELSDVVELVEVCRLFEQAEAAGQPCVVNWSFGGTASFFYDGTLYEQVLNQLVGPGRIIVTAAGNYGGNMTYVKKEANQPLDLEIYYGGYIDSYKFSMRTKAGSEFKVGFAFKNVADTLFIDTRDIAAAMDTGYYFRASIPEVEVGIHIEDAPYGMTGFKLQTTFKGEYIKQKTDTLGITRVYGKILIDTPVEVEVAGDGAENDDFVVIFGNENPLTSHGCHQGTTGYPASVERVVTVGAMHHRSSFTNILGETNTTQNLGSQEGYLAAFSSCGPTMNGRVKPDVVAPGHNIISALNSFYRVNHDNRQTYNEVVPLVAYEASAFGQEYAMFAKSGTSMSSPIAAGVIALWLQAKPDLTPEDIKEVIQRTSRQPDPEFSGYEKNNYYGWGEIDAYAGLLDILNLTTSIPELSRHQPAGISFRLYGRTLHIDGADDGTPIHIYNTDGRLLLSTVLTDGCVSLPASSRAGVYAVQIGRLGSTLIRL